MPDLNRHCSVQDLRNIRSQAALCARPFPDVVREVSWGPAHGSGGPVAEDHVLCHCCPHGSGSNSCASLPHRASHSHPLQHLAHHHQPLLRHWLPALLRLRHSPLVPGQPEWHYFVSPISLTTTLPCSMSRLLTTCPTCQQGHHAHAKLSLSVSVRREGE